jgi:predicted component of type VI protein secretion system
MFYGRTLIVALFLLASMSGCGSQKAEPPSPEKIQQQVERDAAMRAAEDKAERESKK